MAYEGRLAMVGYLDRVLESTIDLATLHAKRLKLFGVSAVGRSPEQRAAAVRGFKADFLPLIAAGASNHTSIARLLLTSWPPRRPTWKRMRTSARLPS